MTIGLSFEDASAFLLARQGSRIKWSLGPTHGLLDLLGHPERHFPAVHIGGTNGKGSTAAFMAAELAARGLRVGVYTSPHLVSLRERVVVDGVPIGADALAEWVSFLKPHIERLDASFFEATTAIACADLAARGVDIAVVEVGLGGRLDSTNVITPLVSVVTKIALEHVEYLGTDLASIAREKAGIAKPGVAFVTGETDPTVLGVVREEAERRGASRVFLANTQGPPTRPLGLRGVHQHANAWVALAALNQLPAPFGPVGDCWPESFERAYIAGRFEVRGRWIFDVAHNPDGMDVLVTTLRAHRPARPLHALVGIRNDKEWRAMLALLAPAVDRLVLTVAPSVAPERRWLLEEIAHWSQARSAGNDRPEVAWEPDFPRALSAVQQGAATMLVTGSFHTVGDALAGLPGFAPVS